MMETCTYIRYNTAKLYTSCPNVSRRRAETLTSSIHNQTTNITSIQTETLTVPALICKLTIKTNINKKLHTSIEIQWAEHTNCCVWCQEVFTWKQKMLLIN